jgi:hypothetical protein
MARIHLFEIEDQSWLPRTLRDAATGFLLVSHKVGKLNKLFVPRLRILIEMTSQRHIVDLGSGAGGPVPSMIEDLNAEGVEVRATLTDLFPNQQSLAQFKETSGVSYEREPIDASCVPKRLVGIRTMIGAFHHLDHNTAQKMLADAQVNEQPIAIFEGFGRNVPSFFALLPSVLMPFFLMPLVRPFNPLNLMFTYIVPILPLIIFFDGWVSFLRIYSPDELRGIVDELPQQKNYRWEIGTVGFQKAPFIIGYPVTK